MEFIISEQLLSKIINYLAVKPFHEVNGLISEINKLKPVKQETKPDEIEEVEDN